MTDNWKEITDPEELFRLKKEGWEIQVYVNPSWKGWLGIAWVNYMKHRARPPQPKMKKERMLAYLLSGQLVWFQDSTGCPQGNQFWIRVPAQDIEIEVPESV